MDCNEIWKPVRDYEGLYEVSNLGRVKSLSKFHCTSKNHSSLGYWSKEKIIEILEDYEFFVDDDFGGHYEHINCSQRALTPLGIVNILDYIENLEQQCKKQKEVIDKLNFIKNRKNQGASQENINKMAIEFVNSYLKEVSE